MASEKSLIAPAMSPLARQRRAAVVTQDGEVGGLVAAESSSAVHGVDSFLVAGAPLSGAAALVGALLAERRQAEGGAQDHQYKKTECGSPHGYKGQQSQRHHDLARHGMGEKMMEKRMDHLGWTILLRCALAGQAAPHHL